MSKKRAVSTERAPSHDWMKPVDDASPCGPDLEYDPEFVVLFAQVAAKMDAQYGDFVGTPEPVNWSDVDRDCRRLMMRSKDIRLAVLFTRCRTRMDGATGLAEGLALLSSWLSAFTDTIHPQPGVDEELDAALEIRMNALQGLTDADGLLSDVRDIALARSSVARLRVRDIERAFAQPRPSDALSVESVTRQLEDLRVQQPECMAGFDRAKDALGAIEAWNQAQLGMFAADLSTLARLLKRVADEARAPQPDPPERPDHPAASPESSHAASIPANAAALQETAPIAAPDIVRHSLPGRESALQAIRDARDWFETNEPSSPISILLRRAEQFVGKRYAEVVKAIPIELLIEWDKDG